MLRFSAGLKTRFLHLAHSSIADDLSVLAEIPCCFPGPDSCGKIALDYVR